MHGFGGGDIAATGEVWCGRFIFEQSFEHGLWSAWHRQPPGKDYDRCRGSFHADRSDALLAGYNRIAICVAVNGG